MKLPQTTFPAPPDGGGVAAKVMKKSDLGKLFMKALELPAPKKVLEGSAVKFGKELK